ncbi:unnamed protein product [Linum trigynum]|uniref:Mitochondrial glycoprotein n=1 Tax=Linum trigynum TaxID=586398 RepID=A0AAV2E094_9ROSI
MALVAMLLRRARCSTGLPPVIPALGAPRTFQSVVRAILCSGKQSPAQGINSAGSGFRRPILGFATASVAEPTADENLVRDFVTVPSAQENLVRALESRIDSAGLPKFPGEFPFDIKRYPERLVLKRTFHEEIVRIEVNLLYEVEIGRIPMLVTITKTRNRQWLEFRLTASPHEFTIESLSVKESEPPASKEESDFSELDCNTQKAFCDYLEAKGIKPNTLNFLFQCVANKDKRECPIWLNKVKNFVEK